MSGQIFNPGTGTDPSEKTWRFEKFNSNEFDMRLLLVGRTGSGKSSVGNSILGSSAFDVSRGGFESTTTKCQVDMVVRKEKRIRVLDTCGMFDAARPHDEVREEIRKSHLMIAPGPHAFLLVLPVEPFTQEHRETVRLLETIFPDFYSNAILVFTKADSLDDDPSKRESKLQEALQKLKEMKELVEKVSGRYVLFDNKEKNQKTLEEQVHHLLDMVHDLHEARGQRHYDSEWFEKAEEAATKGQNAIIKEAKKPGENLEKAIIKNLVDSKVEISKVFRDEILKSPMDKAGRLAFVKEVEKDRARELLKTLSFTALATVLLKHHSKTGEPDKDSANL